MNTLSLAWRNLLRNRRRSLMTLIAMVLGLTTVLLFGGFIRDIGYGMQSDFVKRTGHLQIQHKDYYQFGSGNPAAYAMADYQRVINVVKNDPTLAGMLVVATPTLQFSGIAGNFAEGVSRTVFIHGMVVDDQNLMRKWNDYGQRNLANYSSLSGTAQDAAIIGTGVARVLQLCDALKVQDCISKTATNETQAAGVLPDDIAALAGASPNPGPSGTAGPARIEILAANSRGAPNVAAIKVLYAEFQGIKELDDVYIGLHLTQAQKLIFGAAAPKATAIQLQLHHTAQIRSATERIEFLFKTELKDEPLRVIDYETLNPFYGQTLSMFTAIFGFIAVLIGSIVLFTVANTMSMAVVERTAEIGTLRAMGLRRQGIKALFITEGILLGCFGAFLGIGAAFMLAWIVNHLGLAWTPPGRIEPVALAVRLSGEHAMLIGSGIALVVVGAVSATLPASRAANMNIVDALRHV